MLVCTFLLYSPIRDQEYTYTLRPIEDEFVPKNDDVIAKAKQLITLYEKRGNPNAPAKETPVKINKFYKNLAEIGQWYAKVVVEIFSAEHTWGIVAIACIQCKDEESEIDFPIDKVCQALKRSLKDTANRACYCSKRH